MRKYRKYKIVLRNDIDGVIDTVTTAKISDGVRGSRKIAAALIKLAKAWRVSLVAGDSITVERIDDDD